jgi:hypothetical protein
MGRCVESGAFGERFLRRAGGPAVRKCKSEAGGVRVLRRAARLGGWRLAAGSFVINVGSLGFPYSWEAARRSCAAVRVGFCLRGHGIARRQSRVLCL